MAWKHGTVSGYRRHGCRCEACREAKGEYNRRYYAENREAFNEHKRRYRAENREAVRERKRRYRAENLEAERERDRRGNARVAQKQRFSAERATRSGLPWTPEEDARIMEPCDDRLMLALGMGRSIWAITSRRHELRQLRGCD